MPRPRLPTGLASLLLACCLLVGPARTSGARNGAKQLLQTAPSSALGARQGAGAAGAAAAPASPCCTQLATLGFSSNLPVVVLDTSGGKLEVKDVKVPVKMCTCSAGGWWGAASLRGLALHLPRERALTGGLVPGDGKFNPSAEFIALV